MSRVTAAILVGLASFATQVRAEDAWIDASTRNACNAITSIADRDQPINLKVGWVRGSGKGPSVSLSSLTRDFAHGDSISLASPSLPQPLPLAAGDAFTASGPQVEHLLSDMAAGRNWSVVFHPAKGPERRVEPHVGNAARVFAMFEACRGVKTRAPPAAAVDGRLRAKGMQTQSFGSVCGLTALYHWGDAEIALKLTHRGSTTVLSTLATGAHSSAHIDQSALGGPADVALTDIPDVTLNDVNANLVVTNLLAGHERLVTVRSLIDKPVSLVFGGPEYAIEAAMFKACNDVR